MNGLTFVSLFSGVGGFDLGLERAGWRCVAQVEWDQQCQAVLAHHWPDVPRWSDVCDVHVCRCRSVQRRTDGGSALLAEDGAGARCPRCDGLPHADVVAFGSPCQDLSVAGKRAGFIDGGRSNLFFEAIRIIKEMRDATGSVQPRFVVWENVVGAFSSNQGDDFAAVLDALAEVGAVDIGWRVLDARWFGVPQRRRRVFVVADFAGRCAGAVSTEPEGVRWDSDPCGASGPSAARGVGAGVADGGGIVGTLQARMSKGPNTESVLGGQLVIDSVTALTARCGNTQDDQQIGQLVTHTHTVSALTRGLGSGGPDAAHACAGWLVSERAGGGGTVAGVEGRAADDRHRRSDLGGGAVTVIRRLTPLECERLMGWPDDHTRWRADGTEVSDSARYRMCGNGVASPVAHYVAACINRALEQEGQP